MGLLAGAALDAVELARDLAQLLSHLIPERVALGRRALAEARDLRLEIAQSLVDLHHPEVRLELDQPLPELPGVERAVSEGATSYRLLLSEHTDAQQVLAETQSAILPLIPYLDTLRWVFIAVALIGIAVTIYARIDDWRRGRR